MNLDVTIKQKTFIYKLFHKRDSFQFSIVRIPYIESNTPQNIFYSAIKDEFLRIAPSALNLSEFTLNVKGILERIKQQSSKRGSIGISLRKNIGLSRQTYYFLFYVMTS